MPERTAKVNAARSRVRARYCRGINTTNEAPHLIFDVIFLMSAFRELKEAAWPVHRHGL